MKKPNKNARKTALFCFDFPGLFPIIQKEEQTCKNACLLFSFSADLRIVYNPFEFLQNFLDLPKDKVVLIANKNILEYYDEKFDLSLEKDYEIVEIPYEKKDIKFGKETEEK